jgi:hypothetical protein
VEAVTRVVREEHNTVLIVRNPFRFAAGGVASLRVVHSDRLHGDSFCELEGTTCGYHARFSNGRRKMIMNVSYPAAKGLDAFAVSKEPVVSPDRFRSTRQESSRCVHLISFAMASDASASEQRSPGAGPCSLARVSDIMVGARIWALIVGLQTRVV